MKALILVDMQNDFMPLGALAVPKADEIIPILQKLTDRFDHVLATQDWHPPKHSSFASSYGKKVGEKTEVLGKEQILWPDHCVQNTKGADFVKGLDREKFQRVFQKGKDLSVDSYSAFFDQAEQKSTGLDAYLKEKHIDELYFTGVATEYCVLFSVLDALKLGYKVFLIQDACRGVNICPQDEKEALQKMEERGAHLISFKKML